MERTKDDKEERWYKILLAINSGCNSTWQIAERFASCKAKPIVNRMYAAGLMEKHGFSKEIYYTLSAKGYEFIQQYKERKQNEKRRMLKDCDGDC